MGDVAEGDAAAGLGRGVALVSRAEHQQLDLHHA